MFQGPVKASREQQGKNAVDNVLCGKLFHGANLLV
jgi:hypothetical protein